MKKIPILYVDTDNGQHNSIHNFLGEDFSVNFMNPENQVNERSIEINAIIVDSECQMYYDSISLCKELGYRIEDHSKIPFIVLDYDIDGFISKHEEIVYVNKNIFDGEHEDDVKLFIEYLHSVILTYKQ